MFRMIVLCTVLATTGIYAKADDVVKSRTPSPFSQRSSATPSAPRRSPTASPHAKVGKENKAGSNKRALPGAVHNKTTELQRLMALKHRVKPQEPQETMPKRMAQMMLKLQSQKRNEAVSPVQNKRTIDAKDDQDDKK